MSWALISDSSCNLRDWQPTTPHTTFAFAPLKIRVGEREFVDDLSLDVHELNCTVQAESSASSSACPSVGEWAELFRLADKTIGLPISEGVSGSYKAAATAREWSHAQQEGNGFSASLRMRHAMYDRLIYRTIMGVFGGHCEYAVSGGAPLDGAIAHFFNGVGLPLLEGYGMTETCAPAMVNPTKGYRIGTVGMPLQGVSVGLGEDGELCIKSRAVCVGYHNHPEITQSQIVDGWLHTGDLGDIDDDGFVTITGRKKDLIITAGGKNVSPGILEASVMTSPVVDQCVVIGDRKPFIAAIVSLDLDETNAWLAAQGVEQVSDLAEAVRNPIVYAEVERAVNAANDLVSRAESIRKFEIVPEPFTEENGLLTASMKARRQAVIDHFGELIDTRIYAPKGR